MNARVSKKIGSIGMAGMALGASVGFAAVAEPASALPPTFDNYCGQWNANTQSCIRFSWGTTNVTPTFNLSAGNANTFGFCGHFELSYMSNGQWVHDRDSGQVCFPAGAWVGTSLNTTGDANLNLASSALVTLWKDSGSQHTWLSNSWY